MLYPQHDGVSRDYPGLSTKVGLAGSVRHHRPVVASNLHGFDTHSPSKKSTRADARSPI
ncbi:hypothetical protein JL09_g6244 [Pichia kudriavzevii]|uniref:Uncharacterized protein n=1 Tax=Pichia kudriavzevii TaxID=4909 RepID=A0A099NP88_PICKU|nr:hypothetical protein JL09_g6244 [Pichia kudriavzevii]